MFIVPSRVARIAFSSIAAAAVAAALYWAVARLLPVSAAVAAACGGLAFIRIFSGLVTARDIQSFEMPAFEPGELEFEPEAPAELHNFDNVIALMGAEPIPPHLEPSPTVHELQAAIARHLGAEIAEEGAPVAEPPAEDASDDLREAIQALRRSMG